VLAPIDADASASRLGKLALERIAIDDGRFREAAQRQLIAQSLALGLGQQAQQQLATRCGVQRHM
jgi:hypothetical protein